MKTSRKLNIVWIVAISFLIGLAITLLTAVKSVRSVSDLSENNLNLYRAYEIPELLQKIKAELALIESNGRGFVITGDKQFLESNESEEAKLKKDVRSLSEFLSTHTALKQYPELEQLINDKIDFADRIILIYNEKGEDAARREIKSGRGVRIMKDILDISGSINTISDNINTTIKGSLSDLRERNSNYIVRINSWYISGISISLIVALTASLLMFRDIKKRNNLEQELVQAKVNAEKSAEIKEQFMANMSHEIRTPMNAVIGFTNLLEKTDLNTQQRDYTHTIKNSGENLLAIINDILDFSKIEAGMLRIEKVNFNVSNLLHSIYTMFYEKAAEKGVEMKLEIDQSIPQEVSGDPARLTQILVNLIGNANKFTNKGHVGLIAQVVESSDDKVKIEFSVCDTGIGIPKEKQEEIFGRFNQGNTNTTREYGGTGLGLAIVKKLVELQKGNLFVKSQVGKGSAFTFTLSYPIPKSTDLSKDLQGPDLDLEAYLGSKVLLVEDNPMNQKLAAAVLNGFGFEVSVAANGQLALEMLMNSSYDFVLMDIQMPILDGYMTAQKIRSELKLDLPIIAMTAHVMAAEREKCLGYGMNDYITKPFKEQDLYNMISKYVHLKASTGKPGERRVLHSRESRTTDLDYLVEMAKGNDAFVLEMIDVFIDQTPHDLLEIQKAISRADYEVIKSISHKMRTSISFVGLPEKTEESLLKMEELSAQESSLDSIKQEFELVKSICEQALKELMAERTRFA
jgi:signal transduction histidine kinase/CheY-like chemotaxis protein/HPt (histidine-containing phosphotransfer) domain-containing protein